MNAVKIITDSAADLSDAMVASGDIEVVPLKIRFDDQEFTDGIELSREEFWKRLETSEMLPATSAPSPGAFEDAFRRAAADGYTSVVCLTISSKLSATHQIAVTAATAVSDTIPVLVVDTQACAIAETVLVMLAADQAKNGTPAQEIADHVTAIRSQVKLYGALDTLDYLKKGGRIGAASAFFGSVLSIKPIVSLVDGEVKAVGRARTRSKVIDQLLNLLSECPNPSNVVIGHSYAPDIDNFVERVREVCDQPDITVSVIGPVVGTHTGPRLLALAFIAPPEMSLAVP